MKQHLKQEKLWNTIEIPAAGNLEENEDKVNSALSRIFFSVGPTQLGHIERDSSPKIAWEELKELYGGAKPNKLVRILRKLVLTKLGNFAICDDYIVQVQQTAYDLPDTEFGEVKDPVLVAFLLAGLPDSYEALRQSIDQSTEKVKSEEVKRRIRDTWSPINADEINADNESTVLKYIYIIDKIFAFDTKLKSKSRRKSRFLMKNFTFFH